MTDAYILCISSLGSSDESWCLSCSCDSEACMYEIGFESVGVSELSYQGRAGLTMKRHGYDLETGRRGGY